jgi:heptose-I-phosphate ethanolaminephosphotransferase
LRKTLFFHQGLPADAPEILIVGLLGQAGFETWWLSNQTANSDGLTGTYLFAGDADHRYFFNKSRSEGHSISYDEALLEPLSNALQAKSRSKAIFIHLLGSHLSYHLRYPEEFDFFTSGEGLTEVGVTRKKPEEVAYINSYDNSIRYCKPHHRYGG